MLDAVPQAAGFQAVMKDAEALQIAGTRHTPIALTWTEFIGMIDLTSFRRAAATWKTAGLVPGCHMVELGQAWPVNRSPKIQPGATARFDRNRGNC